MEPVNPDRICKQCGSSLAEEMIGGLCPRCLMVMNFASRTMPGGEPSPQIPPPSPEQMAARFPQFEILECLGRGGMGIVYKARQKTLDRLVAIKVLAGERSDAPQFEARFSREAKMLAKLSHPNIVTVHDFGQSEGMFYLVMEFVDGVNLRDVLRDGRMEPEQALAIIPPICDALEYAHDKGVVHRDIKPENILLDREGRVKIADFGIAALVGVSGEKSGTPPYMAPEQENGIVDRRADIYALGAVLYEMLTGERPNKELVAPSKKVQIDVRLDEIVLRALEKTPELRYQTAGEFRTVLETMVDSQGVGQTASTTAASSPTGPAYQATRSQYRSFVIVGRRGGKAVVNWPGVGLVFLIILGIVLVGGALFCWLLSTPMDARAVIMGLFSAIMATGIGLARARTTPLEQLVDLDEVPTGSSPASRLSRTAILGAFFAILCMSAMILQINVFGIAATAFVTTILGWIAVSEIRRSAGTLHGMWLAVFDGLLFPLLGMYTVIVTVPMVAMKLISWPSTLMPVYLLLLRLTVTGLGLITFAIAANEFIRRVWRAVNNNTSSASPQTDSTVKQAGLSRKAILVAAYVCIPSAWTVLLAKRWDEHKREGVWVPVRISNTITQQYGDAQVRVVDVSKTGQVVVMSFVCEMFRPDHELMVQYGGPVLSYPNDLASSVNAKVKDLDCLITPRAKLVGDNIGEVLAGTNALSDRTMFRVGFVLPDAETAAQVVKAVQEVHLGKPRGMIEGKSVLRLFSLHRDFGKDAAGKPVAEALDASLWSRPKSNATAAHVPVNPGAPTSLDSALPLSGMGTQTSGAGTKLGVSNTTPPEFHWQTVTHVSPSETVIENTEDKPLTRPLMSFEKPPITSTRYALIGEIKYENVEDNAYLEMWSHFQTSGRYFTRTLAPPDTGPMATISGSSDWRAFTLPFDRSNTTDTLSKIDVNLYLPAKGAVYLRGLRLVQNADAFASRPGQAGLLNEEMLESAHHAPASTAPEAPAWGTPDKGASVRLRADKAQWTSGEIPSLKMDLRNLGTLPLSVLQSQAFGTLEVDGIAYQWTAASHLSASSLPPGRIYQNIPVTLDREWMKVKQPGDFSRQVALQLEPGKHIIRFTPVIYNTELLNKGKKGQGPGITCASNPVEIEVVPTTNAATVVPLPWGEAVNGVAIHLHADFTTWTADESPALNAYVRNQGKDSFPLSLQADGNEVELDGQWYAWKPATEIKTSLLDSGADCSIPIALTTQWQSVTAQPLHLSIGQHVIRFAIPVRSNATAPTGETVRVVSNPVKIDIKDGVSRRAALVAKYLPGYTFRSERTGPASLAEVLVAPDGSKVNLAEMRKTWWNFPNPSLTSFIQPLRLRITTAAEAQDITRVVMTVLTGGGNMESWELRAKSSTSGWQVEAVYVGPPAQIPELRPLELILRDGLLVDVAHAAETKPVPLAIHIHLAADGALTVADEPCLADHFTKHLHTSRAKPPRNAMS